MVAAPIHVFWIGSILVAHHLRHVKMHDFLQVDHNHLVQKFRALYGITAILLEPRRNATAYLESPRSSYG